MWKVKNTHTHTHNDIAIFHLLKSLKLTTENTIGHLIPTVHIYDTHAEYIYVICIVCRYYVGVCVYVFVCMFILGHRMRLCQQWQKQ